MEHRCVVPGCKRPLYARGFCNAHYLSSRKYPGETPEQLALRNRQPRTADEIRAVIRSRVIETPTGCWEWQGATDRRGYGNLRWDGKLWGVHRLAYHLFVVPVNAGKEVCHRCDNPPCCNPGHLFIGSHAINMADAQTKGIMAGNGDRSGIRNGRARLTEDDVRAIRASSETQVELAKRYGIGQPAISAIRLRKVWKDVA